jgi:hypothetical protein
MTVRISLRSLALTFIIVGSACERADTGVEPGSTGADLSKYVAMGTSISMGFASDGVVAASQQSSWPKLLANDIGVTFTQPLIDAPGCRPPLASPLSQLKRTDNTSAITQSIVCAANASGVTLPSQNVAVSAQTAVEAFTATPTAGSLSARVLASGQTQTSAMKAQSPTFVSVEFGAAEFLPALGGLVTINTTIVPIETFTSGYDNIITAVKQTGAHALLVTVPSDVTKLPALRTGAEVASQRAAFGLLNVSVNANCDTSPNFVTVTKLLSSLAFAAARASAGLGPFDLSCADVPSSADGILSPAEVATLNTLAAQMNTFITAKAAENGYATMSLGTLYDNSKTGVPFDLATILTSSTPFGPNISLDAVHPSAAGNAILAAAAKAAIVAKYGSITK